MYNIVAATESNDFSLYGNNIDLNHTLLNDTIDQDQLKCLYKHFTPELVMYSMSIKFACEIRSLTLLKMKLKDVLNLTFSHSSLTIYRQISLAVFPPMILPCVGHRPP